MPVPVPAAEVAIGASLVRRLLRAQHPDLATRPLRRIGSGWDTEVFRLGTDLTVRLPRRTIGAQLLESELRWLPELAPWLPLSVPVPVRGGEPDAGYPWRWSVCRYVPGRPVGARPLAPAAALRAVAPLAAFLSALHVPAPADAPPGTVRGVALAQRSERLSEVLGAVPAADRPRVARAWREAVSVDPHPGPSLWLHGDLHALNVLASRGRITGVIDFGDLCAGDPASDLACAWLILDQPSRELLRGRLDGDDAAWARGRGWALYLSVMMLAHSADAPDLVALGTRGLRAVLGDATA